MLSILKMNRGTSLNGIVGLKGLGLNKDYTQFKRYSQY